MNELFKYGVDVLKYTGKAFLEMPKENAFYSEFGRGLCMPFRIAGYSANATSKFRKAFETDMETFYSDSKARKAFSELSGYLIGGSFSMLSMIALLNSVDYQTANAIRYTAFCTNTFDVGFQIGKLRKKMR